MKRIGLMGCGVVADYGHAPAIAATPGLELTALYDPNPAALDALHARFPGAMAFTDSERFLACGLDAVSVTSPAPVHLDNVQGAARHGLHVLCEKPLAMTEDQIEAMIGIMDDARLMLGTAFCYRFSPVARQIKRIIDERWIGDIRALRLIYLWDLHGKWSIDEYGQRYEAPRRVGRFVEGGPMVDCGVHQIDLARYWTGSEIARHQSAAAWIEEHDAPGHVWLHLDHDSGAHTVVEMSFSYCHTAREPLHTFTYELIGSDGLVRYDRDGWRFEVRNPEGTQFLAGSSEKDFYGMYVAWRDALEGGQLGEIPSAHDGLTVTRLARRATEEAIKNRWRK
jgi:predicted dehydrogenase